MNLENLLTFMKHLCSVPLFMPFPPPVVNVFHSLLTLCIYVFRNVSSKTPFPENYHRPLAPTTHTHTTLHYVSFKARLPAPLDFLQIFPYAVNKQ